jgi:hypothetical protein
MDGGIKSIFTNPASMNSFHEQEQRAGRELEMARTGEGRRRKYISRDM